MITDWQLSGTFVEACSCSFPCQCVWREPPDDDLCLDAFAWHIQDGGYRDTDQSGLAVVMLARVPGNMYEVPWDVVLVFDEAADEEQRAALEEPFRGEAGGVFASYASAFDRIETTTAPITVTRDGTSLRIETGDIASVEVTGKTGFNDEVGRTYPHRVAPEYEMNVGTSTTAEVSYDETFTWDSSGGYVFFCEFDLAGA